MPMKMGWRWYGTGNDPITLADIRQIPGVSSIVWALHHKMPGDVWEEQEIRAAVEEIHAYGFDAGCVESVNVHDDIKIGLPTRDGLIENYKIGLPTRDGLIENYKTCIRNLAKYGVKVICYNFMPVFDWTRTDMFHPVGDGSTALFYEKDKMLFNPDGSLTPRSARILAGTPMDRFVDADELLGAVFFLTDEAAASAITGVVLPIDAGFSAYSGV